MIKLSKLGVANGQVIGWLRLMKRVIAILGLLSFSQVSFSKGAIATNIFRAENRIFITNLKPQAKVGVSVQRISFRKVIADDCGEVGFNATTVPDLVLVGKQEFIPARFPLEANRLCTRGMPISRRSYKTSNTRFIIAGLQPRQPHLLRIIRPSQTTITTNRCGYGTIAITETLTPFAGSYEVNIYAVNGKKLTTLPTKAALQCRRGS